MHEVVYRSSKQKRSDHVHLCDSYTSIRDLFFLNYTMSITKCPWKSLLWISFAHIGWVCLSHSCTSEMPHSIQNWDCHRILSQAIKRLWVSLSNWCLFCFLVKPLHSHRWLRKLPPGQTLVLLHECSNGIRRHGNPPIWSEHSSQDLSNGPLNVFLQPCRTSEWLCSSVFGTCKCGLKC